MQGISIELISRETATEILTFEKENRTFFETMVPSRGDEYYETQQFTSIIEELVQEQEQGSCFMYLIRDESGHMVGRVNLFSVSRDEIHTGEIGYRIGEKHNGKGYATNAIKLLVNAAFTTHGLQKLEAGTSPNNVGSQIALLKNGFRFTAKSSELVKVNGNFEESVLFERLRET
jgi:ribosomal-protein-alanine N-acetyltransferase